MWVLVRHLPHDAPLWWAMEQAERAEQVPQADQIRDRAEHYRRLAAQQTEGVTDG